MSDSVVTETYCEVHPNRETSLRCNRCNRLMCTECAVLTPTGYRCKECVRSQQKTFDTTVWYDYVIAILVSGVLSFVGSYIALRIGWFTLLLAPGVGVGIAEAVRFLTGRRRSKALFTATAIAAAVGALPLAVIVLLSLTQGFSGLFSILWQGYYLFIVPTTVYTRHSGLQIRRG